MAFETVLIENTTGDQVIKIPKEFKIDDEKAYIKKIGNCLYIVPYHNPWQSMINSLDEFTDDFMSSRQQPEQQKRESLDL